MTFEELKFLTFGCKHCRTLPARTKQFMDWIAYSVATCGDDAILPAHLRCGWCRRLILAGDAGFDFSTDHWGRDAEYGPSFRGATARMADELRTRIEADVGNYRPQTPHGGHFGP